MRLAKTYPLAFVAPRPLLQQDVEAKQITFRLVVTENSEVKCCVISGWLHQLTAVSAVHSPIAEEIVYKPRDESVVVRGRVDIAFADEKLQESPREAVLQLAKAALPVEQGESVVLDAWGVEKFSGTIYSFKIRVQEAALAAVLTLADAERWWVDTPRAGSIDCRVVWLRDHNGPLSLSQAKETTKTIEGALGFVESNRPGQQPSYALRVHERDLQCVKAQLSLDTRDTFVVSGLPSRICVDDLKDLPYKVELEC